MQGTVLFAEDLHENIIHDDGNQASGDAMVTEQPSVSMLTEGPSSSSTSCVCLKETSGAPTCQQCTRNVHAICGHSTKGNNDSHFDSILRML
ncbi:integrase core domain protein [Plakobranchus ocellatus]|uniref:Integrase core domain protein n=1 Tax=Plakobranchus ocellatus TaxID=259542 RepID=A0AAV3YRA1_9GAST|nr:integrase core domain protein [Plakobranchus ocellatus]